MYTDLHKCVAVEGQGIGHNHLEQVHQFREVFGGQDSLLVQ